MPTLLQQHHARALGTDPDFAKTTHRLARTAAMRLLALAAARRPPPRRPPETEAAIQQSLTVGAAGRALLAVERTAAGDGPWTAVHHQLRALVADELDGGDHAGLFYGAPAVAFVLHRAASVEPRYRAAAARLDVLNPSSGNCVL